MPKPKSFFRRLTQTGTLIVLAAAITLGFGIMGPASAQFFNFGHFGNFGGPPRPAPPPRGGGWFGDFFSPYRPQAPRRVYQDFSKAPPPEKRDTVAERNVLVLGDGMADWLAYGLEDTYADQPEMGVIRKVKNTSGLIRYQPRGEPPDWIAAAKDILATEKPDAIVVMLGLNDRIAIHESESDKSDKKGAKKDPKKDAHAGQDAKSAPENPDTQADTELPPDDADNPDLPPIAPEKSARAPNGIAEFRDERWIELYSRKIEEMIAVLKSKGVPVIWVGLPAVRGAKSTSDMLFLDSLYRDAAGKAGITYVDIWDGFVDEAGRYLQKGPDFEGQTRVLRTYDGVYFTRAGARKLAHYVEREISRLLAARSAPFAIPSEPATPEANAVPGQPAPRPLAGPILPLVASSLSSDELLGGPGTRPAAVDPLAARTLVKGEALTAPAGRADDDAWPRRMVEREPAKEPPKSETPMASTKPAEKSAPPMAARVPEHAALAVAPPRPAPKQPQPPPTFNPFRNFFRFGNTQH